MSNTPIAENSFGYIKKYAISAQADGLVITHQHCTARVSLYGGQVLSWQPEGEQEVFWLSKTSKFGEQGTAIRGGVPICWPWFGVYQKGNLEGRHGFVRQQQWQLDEVSINETAAKVILTLKGNNNDPLWPYGFELKQELLFGKQFEQRLYISNTSDQPVEYSAALHNYFNVSAPENTQIEQLAPLSYTDTVTGLKDQHEELINCLGRIDRVYQYDQSVELIDNKFNRAIKIQPINTKEWALWNPGAELAATMSDIHPQGEKNFVCLETANTRWQSIAANSSDVLGQVVSISGYLTD